MKLAAAALLMLTSAFGQSRWYDHDYAEARREAAHSRREVRFSLMRAARLRREIRESDRAAFRRERSQALREGRREIREFGRRDRAR